ncbi:hypothetical protein, partial [Komagataeibacter nataicola]|uniref:hypothetical protein n=1 Tax=Komagataeibacter nataicola TaxID=265960 RepID=UPI001B866222
VCVALQKSRLNGPSSLSHTTAKEWHGFRQHKPGQPRRYQPQNAQPDRLLGERRVRHLSATQGLPLIKKGNSVCADPNALIAWVQEKSRTGSMQR